MTAQKYFSQQNNIWIECLTCLYAPCAVSVVVVSPLSMECCTRRLGLGSSEGAAAALGSADAAPGAGVPFPVMGDDGWTRILSSSPSPSPVPAPASASASLQLLGRLPKLTEVCLLAARLSGSGPGPGSQILISQELISRAFSAEQSFIEAARPPPPVSDLRNCASGAFLATSSAWAGRGGQWRLGSTCNRSSSAVCRVSGQFNSQSPCCQSDYVHLNIPDEEECVGAVLYCTVLYCTVL